MKKGFLVAAALMIGTLTVGLGSAMPVPALNVSRLARDADVIVVGRITDHQVDAQHKSEQITITGDRMLKGSAKLNDSVIRLRLDRSQPSSSTPASGYGMFFLRAAESGTYEAVDPFRPALVASSVTPSRTGSRTLVSRITAELVNVLETPPEQLPANGATSQDAQQHFYAAAAEAIDSLPSAATKDLLWRASASDQPLTRLWAIRCLVVTGDIRRLATVQDTLVNTSPDTEFSVEAFANAMEGHLKTSESVPFLSALLQSRNVGVRRAAASVLGEIATPAVLKPLASTALNDRDNEVRYFAVSGLAEATGANEVPSIDQFHSKESEYMGFWARWATQHGY